MVFLSSTLGVNDGGRKLRDIFRALLLLPPSPLLRRRRQGETGGRILWEMGGGGGKGGRGRKNVSLKVGICLSLARSPSSGFF